MNDIESVLCNDDYYFLGEEAVIIVDLMSRIRKSYINIFDLWKSALHLEKKVYKYKHNLKFFEKKDLLIIN